MFAFIDELITCDFFIFRRKLKPSVPRDHAIMLNVAELVERVFPYIRQSSFAPWVGGNIWISHSNLS